jgi:hypothetical protein
MVPQLTVEEGVMGQVRASETAEPAIARIQAKVQREVNYVKNERRKNEKPSGLQRYSEQVVSRHENIYQSHYLCTDQTQNALLIGSGDEVKCRRATQNRFLRGIQAESIPPP